MPSKSVNADVNTLNCTESLGLPDQGKCRAVSGGGICVEGPAEEFTYKPAASDEKIEHPASLEQTTEEQATKAITPPTLGIDIPELYFSKKVVASGGFLHIPFIGEYIAAIYKYLVGISIVAAAIMIVYGGFRYITGASIGSVQRGKEIIRDALIGLLLVLGSYTILATINPDTLSFKAVRLTPVMTDDYKFMIQKTGFKWPEGTTQAEVESAASNEPLSGSADLVAPQEGENVSLEKIDLTGLTTAAQKLDKFCLDSATAAGLETYDKKIQALVKVVLGFHKVCIQDKQCAYYRGGFTSFPSGKIQGTSLDIPYAENKLKAFMNRKLNINKPCKALWEGLRADFYSPPEKGTYKNLEEFKKLIAEKKVRYKNFLPGGGCYQEVFAQYQREFGDRYEEAGILAGDCGTTLIMMYKCAGGKVSRPTGGNPANIGQYTSGQRYEYGPEGKDVVVWKAKDAEDFEKQVKNRGGLKFGDIFNIGSQNWQHNFMYTGGRDDVPFEFIEMGSSGNDGSGGVKVSIKGIGAPIGGMYSWPKGSTPLQYLKTMMDKSKQGKNIFPVTVWRPYDYEPCGSRSECKQGQACKCTTSDTKNREKWLNNACASANLCHSVKLYITCLNDEHCGVGTTCRCTGGGTDCKNKSCYPTTK